MMKNKIGDKQEEGLLLVLLFYCSHLIDFMHSKC